MTEQFTNFAQSVLSAPISASQTMITVAQKSTFPLLGNFRIVVQSFESTTGQPTSAPELMLVTAVAGTTFTVQRGAESTKAIAFAGGATVTHIVTAAVMQALQAGGGGGSLTLTDGTNTVSGTTQITVTGGTVGGTSPNATLTFSGSGSGNVVGPASSTDNAITRYDGTTGLLIQNSLATVDDSGVIGSNGANLSGALNLATTTSSRALVTDASKNVVSSATTAAEIGFVSGVTSAIQTQLNGKQASGNYITALTGDVTASGPGSVAATLANTAVTPGSYTYTSLTVDSKGRITAASNGTAPSANALIAATGATFDGAGAVLTVGTIVRIYIPYACTINSVTLLADQSGSAVFDIKKSTYAGFPTTTSIVASAPPTLSAAQKSQDTTLTGWTTAVAAGDVLEFSVTSATTVTRVNLTLKVTKT